MSKLNRRYDWQRSREVLRREKTDYKYALKAVAVPRKLDLRTVMPSIVPPVVDQLDLGSCVENAAVALFQTLQLQKGVKEPPRSRLFLYYNVRAAMGTIHEDSGSTIKDAVKQMAKTGLATEAWWPYNLSKWDVKPTARCYTNGLNHQILQYQNLINFQSIINAVAAGHPVIFGFTVYESFEEDSCIKDGYMPLPDVSNESILGGHGVAIYGYDLDLLKSNWRNPGAVLVRNSWGTEVHQQGYFWMPIDFVKTGDCSDFWIVTGEET